MCGRGFWGARCTRDQNKEGPRGDLGRRDFAARPDIPLFLAASACEIRDADRDGTRWPWL